MAAVTSYVEQHPGCLKVEAARAVGPHGSTKYGYAAVDRALRAKLIELRPVSDGRYAGALHVTDDGS